MMLKNYFKIAWRNLLRSKTYSSLVVFGLASGMTCAVILALYVRDELSFDRYHQNTGDIYRINLNIQWEENEFNMGLASPPFGPALKQEYPEVKNTLRVKKDNSVFRAGEKSLRVKEVVFADSSLFSFFDYAFTEGNPQTALSGLNNVVLTEKLALVLFGRTTGVIGKVVTVKNNIPFKVSAVIKRVPSNHHLAFDAILPYANKAVSAINEESWVNFSSSVYVLLDKNADAAKLAAKMPAFYKKYIAREIGDEGGGKVRFKIAYQPLADIHLHSTELMGEENGSKMSYIYTFSVIGLFILLIAVVNYINLATARSMGRAKEIGVRKAVGSQKIQLVSQFLAESMLASFLALFITIGLVYLLLPFFNLISEKTLTFDPTNPLMLGFLTGFAVLTGLASGLYPAFILSRFKPAMVLKGSMSANGQGALLRKSLVVVQFSISMIMIVGTIVVYRQLQFMRHSQLGFNQQQVIMVSLKGSSAEQSGAVLKSSLLQNPIISSVSLTNGSIGGGLNNKSTFSFYAKGKEQSISTEHFRVDADFLNVLQIRVSEGRNFQPGTDHDSSHAVLVNRAMIRRLGWKNRTSGLIEIDTRKVPITGIVEDFHIRSLHQQIEPLVLVYKKEKVDQILIRVAGQNIAAALDYIENIFKKTNPGLPFEYAFLDQTFARQYKSDERKGSLFLAFSGVAIIIACMGLFGLATFTAEQRTKEIGVRKVLGASVASVVALLSRDFLKLVMIAIIIATPVAWYLMHGWLQNFAYKIDIEWWVFVLAGSISVLIAVFTVSFQSIKAALINPVRSLRAD
ncbi:ABC transporter permease [Dyadobacter bucti]|uniref:ABC transporter permease n=1 Tax=Dyadobacter bucti TaxID=2572203 RepID=UPI0011099078|nr:ABC transporter permease [Dyadobacter bucti]